MKINKINRISLSGGLIGLLTTNPRKALEDNINQANKEGWNAVYVMPHKTTNLFAAALQVAVLVCTIGLWTFGAGYIILLEKESN